VERVVVGLELCPFAAEPLHAGRVRFSASEATTPEALADSLAHELAHLDREPADRLETTLLVHPHVLGDFEEFNRFLDVADLLLRRLDLEGVIQVASFHPDYRFEGAAAGDPANATNQSPYPMLHLLRESSVERATRSHLDPGAIPRRNAEKLRALGWDGLSKLL
jgi:hypothetical protein